jgi:hypothetical protein
MADEPVFIFLATYHREADAQLDYAALKEPHSAGVIGTYDAAVGGLAGGVIGHFWNGMSRKDVMELGEMLDDGAAALLIVGRSKLDKALEKAEKEAQ